MLAVLILVFLPQDIAVTASADASIRVWHIPSAQCLKVLKAHDTAITGLSLHPTGDYVLSSSTDTSWALSDLRTGKLITKTQDSTSHKGKFTQLRNFINDDFALGLTCAQFHPDGIIFGIGTQESVIKIWDLKECNNVADFPGHAGSITAIAFSENGTECHPHLATIRMRSALSFRLLSGHCRGRCVDQTLGFA